MKIHLAWLLQFMNSFSRIDRSKVRYVLSMFFYLKSSEIFIKGSFACLICAHLIL